MALDNITPAPASTAVGGITRRSVVDADAHLDPPHEMWKDYLPEHLRALAPYIEEGEEHDWIVFEGERRPMKMIHNQAGRQGQAFRSPGKRAQRRAPRFPEQRPPPKKTPGN